MLALNTGLRAGEVWGLRPADIQLQTFDHNRKSSIVAADICKSHQNETLELVFELNERLLASVFTRQDFSNKILKNLSRLFLKLKNQLNNAYHFYEAQGWSLEK